MATKDYFAELEILSQTIEVAECTIPRHVMLLGASALFDVENRYGEQSRNPQSHHNAEHSLGVIRRGIKLTNILHEFITTRYQEDIFGLVPLAGATHDYEQGKGLGKNERASARYAVNIVRNTGHPELNRPSFIKRLRGGVMATEIAIDEKGKIDQPNLHKGEADPLKFIMAFADINAIAMEGTDRMINDATNLCFERNKIPSVSQYKEFLISQTPFLRRRLNDWTITADIERYFPAKEQEVYDALRENFHDNIISAYNFSIHIPKIADLDNILGEIISKANPFTAGAQAVKMFKNLS